MKTTKFSQIKLKEAQVKLKNKDHFEINENNYREYEEFILNSYEGIMIGENTMKTIDKFENEHYFLSNFYNIPVEYEGIKYLNNEAAFQAQKDLSRRIEFSNLPPNKAKSLGRKVNLRNDWEKAKIQIMYDLVLAKFTQNENLRKKLIATEDAKLVEGNWWNDKFWGICNGEGRNELGKILEKVREELKSM